MVNERYELLKRKLVRKNELIKEIKKSKNSWKKRQLEGKLFEINNKYFPKVFWNSIENGTYKR